MPNISDTLNQYQGAIQSLVGIGIVALITVVINLTQDVAVLSTKIAYLQGSGFVKSTEVSQRFESLDRTDQDIYSRLNDHEQRIRDVTATVNQMKSRINE